MNRFISKKIKKALESASSKEYRNYIIKEGYLLDKIGISNETDLLKFHYIAQYVPIFIKNLLGKPNKQLETVASEYLLNNLNKIKSNDDIKEVFANYITTTSLIKFAYPNSGTDIDPIKNYNINKWKTALNDIVIRSRVYNNFAEAFTYTTKGWTDMDEKLDFERWISKQTSGVGKLYKSAMYGNEQQLPIDLQHIPGLTPKPSQSEHLSSGLSVADKTRNKVLSRINSLERILSTKDGRVFLGSDYNKIVHTLLDLKGDILKIKSLAMLEDVILRARNSLEKSGCNSKAVTMFTKLAQLPPLDMGGADAGMPPPPPDMGLDMGGPAAAPPGGEVGSPEDGKNAVDQFILNMKGFKNKEMTPDAIEERFQKIVDDLKKNEKPKQAKAYSWVNINTPELKKFEILATGITKMASEVASNLVSLGQMAPPPPETITNPGPKANINVDKPSPAPEKPINIDVENIEETPPKDDLETFKLDTKNEIRQKDPIDAAFENIKISDVIVRLEALTRVFKNREIARQMGIIDLMLDRLGLSGFFPSLAEATRSALESNQYCQSRIEEVLSKLVSATDITGRSIIDENLLEPGKNNKPGKPEHGNIIDQEVASYLDETPNKSSEPKPVVEEDITEKKLPNVPIKPPIEQSTPMV